MDYPSGEELDESRVITEQSFEVDLNDWGEVRFVSYLPTYDTLWEDVSFVAGKGQSNCVSISQLILKTIVLRMIA